MSSSIGTSPETETPAVLIIDDNPINLIAFEAALEPLRLRIDRAEGGEAGLAAAARTDYAVILLDVRMPGMDGFETAAHLRRIYRTRHTPIVFTSAYDSTPNQLTKAYMAGATDYIPSPVDEEVLRYKVSSFIALWRRSERLKRTCLELERANAALEAEVAACRGAEESLRLKAAALKSTIETLRAEIASSAHFPSA